MRVVRLVLIGCGRIARRHIEAIERSQGQWKLVGIVEPDDQKIPAALGHLPRAHSPEAFGALGAVAFDGVVIASPSGYHAAHALWAIRHGVRVVIMEKPIALSLGDTAVVVAAARAAAVRLFCCYPMRLYPTLRCLKEALGAGGLGELRVCEAHIYWTRPQAYFDAEKWRGTRSLDGGLWLNQANHILELLVWLCGAPSRLWAQAATLDLAIEMADTAVMMGRWAGGMMGSVSATVLAWPRNMETSLTLLGSRGSVRLEGPGLGEVAYWECEDQEWAWQVRQVLFQEANDEVVAKGYAPSYASWWAELAAGARALPPQDAAHWMELARWCDALELASADAGYEVI